MNIHFTFHPERCVGCGACVMACINENGIDVTKQQPYRLIKHNEYGDGAALSITWFVHGCMHCAAHPCAAACPKGCFAVDRVTGLVHLDNAGCVGCRRCEKACPFEAIQQVGKRAEKCNGCLARLQQGQLPDAPVRPFVEGHPATVQIVDRGEAVLQEFRQSEKRGHRFPVVPAAQIIVLT